MHKQLVLAGCGHSHLLMLRKTSLFLSQKIKPVLIDPDGFWHSGLSVGVLSGTYAHEENNIDPAPLSRRYGFEYVKDRIVSIDLPNGEVILASGKILPFSALSFNIGSVVATESLEGPLQHTWPVKPARNLSMLRYHLETLLHKKPKSLKICIVGGGPSACEVAGNLSALGMRHGFPLRIILIAASVRLLPHVSSTASREVEKILKQRGVKIFLGQKVQRIDEFFCRTADGRIYEFDKVVLATGLKAPPLFRIAGLQTGTDGSLKVRKTLQSATDPRIFGAGDCIEVEDFSLPKTRIHSIRQVPVLQHNLIAFLNGRKLKTYSPKEEPAAILNMGLKKALKIKAKGADYNQLNFLVKDWLEKRFVESNK